MRRHEVIRLGVTYETEVDCDISKGLHYTWSLLDSAGRVFSLPLVDTHRQKLKLPSLLLNYDTYTAIARVSNGENCHTLTFKLRPVTPDVPLFKGLQKCMFPYNKNCNLNYILRVMFSSRYIVIQSLHSEDIWMDGSIKYHTFTHDCLHKLTSIKYLS